MTITKYEHACLDIKEGNSRLIIDSGVYSKSLTNFTGVTGVVVTHIHQDHFDPEKIKAILSANPDVKIFTTNQVAKEINSANVIVADKERTITIGSFSLEFFGENHARIDPNYPIAQNVGVLVNNHLFYPGDSFSTCSKPYELLAIPTMAPWLKFSETSEYLKKSPAKKVFPTHNGFLNEDGQALYDRLIGNACQNTSKEYKFINVGESIEM